MNNSKARCSAFDKAVDLLTFKDRTTLEIQEKLKEKGYSLEEIEDAVDKLSYYGYLNDENYALSYIKGNAKNKGKRLITRELANKGISKDLVCNAYEDFDVDERTVISDIMEKRYSLVDFKEDKTVRRIINYFLRRGFSYENINFVLRKYKIECSDENYC